MADQKSKLKSPLSDGDSSGDDEKCLPGNDDDLGLSLDKLNLGPRKKLLVLCLGGLLVHRVHLKEKHTVRGLRPDIEYGKFLVFKRPYCADFLKFCFERFDVAIWSSAMEHNIESVLDNITGGMMSKFVFVWSQVECTDSGHSCLHKPAKPVFLKELKKLFGRKYINDGQYSASNTLLIDHEPHTTLFNPPHTAIFPDPYKKHDKGDTVLGPGGQLRKYLEGLVDAKDVPSYVKDNPFGQPAITPTHRDWNYYSNIVGKKGSAETSSEVV